MPSHQGRSRASAAAPMKRVDRPHDLAADPNGRSREAGQLDPGAIASGSSCARLRACIATTRGSLTYPSAYDARRIRYPASRQLQLRSCRRLKVDLRSLAASLFYPVTEWINYALLGFFVGAAWAFFGPAAALVVLVVGTFSVRAFDRLRSRLATTLGLDVTAPTLVQLVFSQTIGVVILIGIAGLWGVQIAPVEVLGIAVLVLVLTTALALWVRGHMPSNPR